MVEPEEFIVYGAEIFNYHIIWCEEQGGGAACADADTRAFGEPHPRKVHDGDDFVGGERRIFDWLVAIVLRLRAADFPLADVDKYAQVPADQAPDQTADGYSADNFGSEE